MLPDDSTEQFAGLLNVIVGQAASLLHAKPQAVAFTDKGERVVNNRPIRPRVFSYRLNVRICGHRAGSRKIRQSNNRHCDTALSGSSAVRAGRRALRAEIAKADGLDCALCLRELKKYYDDSGLFDLWVAGMRCNLPLWLQALAAILYHPANVLFQKPCKACEHHGGSDEGSWSDCQRAPGYLAKQVNKGAPAPLSTAPQYGASVPGSKRSHSAPVIIGEVGGTEANKRGEATGGSKDVALCLKVCQRCLRGVNNRTVCTRCVRMVCWSCVGRGFPIFCRGCSPTNWRQDTGSTNSAIVPGGPLVPFAEFYSISLGVDEEAGEDRPQDIKSGQTSAGATSEIKSRGRGGHHCRSASKWWSISHQARGYRALSLLCV